MHRAPSARIAAGGFTLIEIIGSIGALAIAIFIASAAIGSLIRVQTTAYNRAVAGNIATLIGSWRTMDLAVKAYSFYANTYSIPYATTPTTMTESDWGCRAWPNRCELLATVSPTFTPANHSYSGGTIDERPTGTSAYFVNLTNTVSTGLAPGTITNPWLGSSTNTQTLDAARDMVITFQFPAASGVTGPRYGQMCIWQAPRFALDGTNSKATTLSFIGRYTFLDGWVP